MFIVLGLGNPGTKYNKTRHNVGKEAVLASVGAHFEEKTKLHAEVLKTEGGIFAVPTTYMNESGVAAAALVNFYKIKPEELLVVHDDLDIPVGSFKLQFDRGPAGHNGIKSLIEHLGTKKFWRLRIGIEPTPESGVHESDDFVVEKFAKSEVPVIKDILDKTKKVIEEWVSERG